MARDRPDVGWQTVPEPELDADSFRRRRRSWPSAGHRRNEPLDLWLRRWRGPSDSCPVKRARRRLHSLRSGAFLVESIAVSRLDIVEPPVSKRPGCQNRLERRGHVAREYRAPGFPGNLLEQAQNAGDDSGLSLDLQPRGASWPGRVTSRADVAPEAGCSPLTHWPARCSSLSQRDFAS